MLEGGTKGGGRGQKGGGMPTKGSQNQGGTCRTMSLLYRLVNRVFRVLVESGVPADHPGASQQASILELRERGGRIWKPTSYSSGRGSRIPISRRSIHQFQCRPDVQHPIDRPGVNRPPWKENCGGCLASAVLTCDPEGGGLGKREGGRRLPGRFEGGVSSVPSLASAVTASCFHGVVDALWIPRRRAGAKVWAG